MRDTIIGLIGCGNVGSFVAKAVRERKKGVELGALFDLDRTKAEGLAKSIGEPSLAKASFEELIKTDLQLVVETASADAVREYSERVLKAGKDLIILSVGGLLDDGFRERLVSLARRNRRKLIIPSGAIGGLDILKASSVAEIKEITLTTTKNPANLGLGGVTKRTLIFDGSADEAVKLYPKNINVAAAVAIASGVRPRVRIFADPDVRTNIHQVEVRGAFGEAKLTVSNLPSPSNPRTSYLAALSVVRAIEGAEESIVIGT